MWKMKSLISEKKFLKKQTSKIVTLKIILFIIVITIIIAFLDRDKSYNDTPKAFRENITWQIIQNKSSPMPKISSSSEIIKFIEDKFNINISVNYQDSLSEKQMKTMVVEGSLPDIISMPSQNRAGKFLASSDLVYAIENVLYEMPQEISEMTYFLYNEFEGNLYGIPGLYDTSGFLMNKTNGVYVAQPFYDLLGEPVINNYNDLLSLSNRFKNEYISLCIEGDLQVNEGIIPVILGNFGSGIELVEKMFGVEDFSNGDIYNFHKINSPKWLEILTWLDELSRISPDSMSLTGSVLEQGLNGSCLFYIGDKAYIEWYNLKSNPITYREIDINDMQLPVSSINVSTGYFQTYIVKKDREISDTFKKMINYLISDEGNNLVQFGIENKHWILENNTPKLLSWVKKEWKLDSNKFLQETGIGLLPYLSREFNQNALAPIPPFANKNPIYGWLYSLDIASNE